LNRTYLKLALDLDFVLIAITASLKDYILCHKINSSMPLNFVKVSDHEVYFNVDEEPLSFTKFQYLNEHTENEYFILNNRNSEGFLIPEMKKVDFFMVIHQFIDNEDLNNILIGLNKLSDIQVAAQIDPLKLKSRENLVL
jgi:RIO-like serine/threonine protein kinase